MKPKHSFYLFILLELLILLFLGIWVFQKSPVLVQQTTDPASLQNFALPRGTYDVIVDFTSDDAHNAAAFITQSNDAGFLADQLQCYPWRNSDTIQLWCLKDYEDLSFVYSMTGSELTFSSISIYSTNDARRIVWVSLFSLFVLLHLMILWFKQIYLKSSNRKGTILRTLLLFASAVIACRPLLLKNLFYGDDQLYHLERIEGICEALASGQFPVRISPYFLDGAGYAVSVFYGDATLYLAAFFHLMGIPLQTSFKLYIIIFNFITVFLAWFSFSRVLKSKWGTILASMTYVLALYRLSDLYIRSSVGEYTAMAFIPLVLCGFYLVFTKTEPGKAPWIMIASGMSAILVTHCLTSLMITIVLAIWCLCYLKTILQKKRIIPLLLTIGSCLCLSAYFLIPFADYLLSGKYYINASTSSDTGLIRSTGLTLQGLLNLSIHGTSSKTLGILPFFILLVFVILTVLRSVKKGAFHRNKHFLILAFMSLFTLFLATVFFPWDFLSLHIPFICSLAKTIQFSFRFTTFAIFFISWEAGLLVDFLNSERYIVLQRLLYVATLLALCATALFSEAQIVSGATTFKIYGRTGLQLYIGYDIYQGYMASDDFYLPIQSNIEAFKGMTLSVSDSSLQTEDYTKSGLTVTLTCQNTSNTAQTLTVPLLYYKGYQAWDTTTGQKLSLSPNDSSVVSVTIPAGFNDAIKIAFVEPWYWRVAEILSFMSWIFLFLACGKYSKNLLFFLKKNKKS